MIHAFPFPGFIKRVLENISKLHCFQVSSPLLSHLSGIPWSVPTTCRYAEWCKITVRNTSFIMYAYRLAWERNETGPLVVCLHDCVMKPLKELREQGITKNPQVLLKDPWKRSQGLPSRQITVDLIWVNTFKPPELEPAAMNQTQRSRSQGSFSMRPCVICQSGQAAV